MRKAGSIPAPEMNAAVRADVGKIRGVALRELLQWYAQTEGQEALDAVASRLEMHDGPVSLNPHLPAFGLMSMRWYDAAEIHDVLDAIAKQSDAQRVALVGGRHVTEKTLSGVFRAVFKMIATPERYARHAQRLWSQYYDSGEFVVEPLDGRSLTTIRGWRSHHRMLCSINVAAAEVIYEAMGVPKPRARRLRCVDLGASECRYELRYG